MDKEKDIFADDKYQDMTEDENVESLEDHVDDDFEEDYDEMSDPWERENARLQEKENTRTYSLWN